MAIAVFILVITTYLLVWRPDYNFFDGGLMTAILLTMFIKKDAATHWMGAACTVIVVVIACLPHRNPDYAEVFIEHFFSLILVVSATLLTLFVKRLYRTLEADENQLDALFRNATEGIILTNSKGRIVLANPEVERLFGYPSNEILGKDIEILIPKRYYHSHVHQRNHYMHQPLSRPMGHGLKLFGLRKDGSEFPVEVSLSHFRQSSEDFVLAFVMDITTRRQAENEQLEQKKQLEQMAGEMQQLNQELERKVESRTNNLHEAMKQLELSQTELRDALDKEKELGEIKSRFVSMASHEFRTPLSAILSSAALIGKYTTTGDQEKREKHVHKIREAVKHLNELLEDFLSLGRIEEGKIQTTTAYLDLQSFISDTAEEVQGLLKPGQVLHRSLRGTTGFITDKRLLKHIFVNLLTNASKFSPADSPIDWQIWLQDDRIYATVTDRGMGIPDEDKPYLFSSFFRARNVTNIQGTGLGLHIVKRYVDMLQGSIEVDSEHGEGTTIRLSFPNHTT
ncbi:PAS domain-containing sensor histidine kinase [Chitinophaga horti]|uniref:histidine kinase n=1 Tax=Chitinophaga horti TaxID=2920382 RepID=A0ABY6IWY8_9BACT|nr:PAS domain-containing sensor histidine kinase [Chitinophaga horti]UYQ91894.1 PAS domain-containing sensor histidine kinase [Chitinophaga horti]